MGSLLDRIDASYRRDNRLQNVVVELTHACPSDCVHCYLNRNTRDELSFQEWAGIFKQLADEGTVNLGFTGGEPMARKDFAQILEEARKYNFFMSILTTGVLIKQPEVDLLMRNGIQHAEISLLGGTAATHDAIMRLDGAFDRMVNAVKLLRAAGMPIVLKSTVMKANMAEIDAMKKLSADLGCVFVSSVAVSTKDNGDPTPLSYSLNAKEIEQLDPVFVQGGMLAEDDYSSGAFLTCRAGATVGCISPRGDVYPCSLLPKSVGNLREKSFQEIWHKSPDPMLIELRGLEEEDSAECFSCSLRKHCRRCPGTAYMETGSITNKAPSSCITAEGILRVMKKE